MCKFFSFVTDPENNGGKHYYSDWEYRQKHMTDEPGPCDSHSSICKRNNLKQDSCNSYEYNPLTGLFEVDTVNSRVDDRIQAEEWVRNLDFKRVVAPLVIKPIVNPFDLPIVNYATDEHKLLLKQWDSVWDLVRDSVWDSVRASVWDSVRDSVWDSVWDSVRDSVLDSVRDSVWDSVRDSVVAYFGSFFDIRYKVDIAPNNELWESGLVPSFDGKTWRLYSGKNAQIVYEISAKELRNS